MSTIDDGAPLLFIHGIYGGHLRDVGGRRWLGWSQALAVDRRPLQARLTWTDGVQDDDGLRPDGVIESVAVVTVYKPFLTRARARHNTFIPFAYDWRRALPESAARLTAELERIAAEYGRPARIVAHSMGGLVTFLALRERPDLAAGVVFVGVPFGTGIGFLQDTHIGFAPGLNRRICSPPAANSWAAHWAFFPTDGRGLVADGKPLDHDWYDPASWEHHGLGAFAAGAVNDVAPYRTHLAEAMPRARKVRALVEDPGELASAGLPVAVVRSSAHPTPVTVVRDGPKAVRGWDVETVQYEDGDHRVQTANALPPGIEHRVFESELAHTPLPGDHAAVEGALAWLVERA